MAENVENEDIQQQCSPDQMTWQEMLIELVRVRPCLFDKSHRDYSDTRGVKQNNWADVANALVEAGFTVLKDLPTSKYKFEIYHINSHMYSICTFVCICKYVCTCIHTHNHTYTHTYIGTYIHTNIHTTYLYVHMSYVYVHTYKYM